MKTKISAGHHNNVGQGTSLSLLGHDLLARAITKTGTDETVPRHKRVCWRIEPTTSQNRDIYRPGVLSIPEGTQKRGESEERWLSLAWLA
jgi:hypothetical protein